MKFGYIPIFGFFIFVLGFMGVMGTQDYRKQIYAHDHYQPVDATITTSKLVFSTFGSTSSPPRGGARAEIGYSYAMQGKTYKAWRYAYLSPEVSANEMLKRYPLGAHVTVYVDPDNPAEAILYNAVAPIPQIISWVLPFPIVILIGWFIYRRLARWALNSKKNGAAQ